MTERHGHLQILVLCAGNIGRSPLAEAMLRARLAKSLNLAVPDLEAAGVSVTSAGTAAPEGHAASARGIVLATKRGLDLSGHRARQLTRFDLETAGLVLCMDNQQVDAVAELLPDALSKTELIAADGVEVPDPRNHDDLFFNKVAEQIEAAVSARIPSLVVRIRGQA